LVGLLKVRMGRAVCQPGCWQRGYWEKVIRGFEDPGDVVKYILMNPVRAGLAPEIGIYPYCGTVDSWL
jgi:putative transposase